MSGAALAVLLLVNSIMNYNFVSRRIVVDQIRREMSRQAAQFEQQSRAGQNVDLASVIKSLRKDDKALWLELRDRDGKIIARTGADSKPAFTEADIHSRMRNREPLVKVVKTATGEAVVEAFPIRIPNAAERRSVPGLLEIATSTEGATAAFWPIRRNLIINCSAAIALLVALLLMALRFKGYVQGKQLEQQIEIASGVQRALLPSRHPEAITVAAEFLPMEGVGGDFYDVFDDDNGRVAMLLGDVSGKGLPASLLMGVIHGAVRSSNWTDSAADHEHSAARLNRLLCERASSERFATMFWSYFDERAQTLSYINAGHCAPLLVKDGRGGREVIALEEGGPVLGLLPSARYKQAQVRLSQGDLLVMFSDGIVEAPNAAGEEFGEERLRALVAAASPDITPIQLRQEILEAVRTFTGAAQLHDDLTLVAVRFEPALANASGRYMEAVA